MLEPTGPGFLRHALPDLLAKFARQRREVEAFGFLVQLDAMDHAGHVKLLVRGAFVVRGDADS
ncbi:hypothetical protein D3C71_2194560 [compost metagenome]